MAKEYQNLEKWPKLRSIEPRGGEKVGTVIQGFGSHLDPRFVLLS